MIHPCAKLTGPAIWVRGAILSSSPIPAGRNAVASAFSTRDDAGRIKGDVPAGFCRRPFRCCPVEEHVLFSVTGKKPRETISPYLRFVGDIMMSYDEFW